MNKGRNAAVSGFGILTMKMKLVCGLALAVASSLLFSGCVVALGNKVPEGKVTLGKQLTDLKQARDSGAITEDEYQTAKKRLVEGKETK
jgi:hypothetical protein